MFDIVLMFRKQLMLFFFYFLILASAQAADHVDESLQLPKAHTLPFKLGFEFQEISSLCPWAWPNNKIQKQALFEFIGSENKRLWHVELDTLDIEFVTAAFSFKEHLALELALKTITLSINSLTELLNHNHGSITFGDWVEGLRRSLPSDNCKLTIIQEWVLPRTLVSTTLPWKPTIAPQATIQHPLEWTIPLYFGLFGFESSQMLPFYGSLPYRELLRKAAKGLNRTESGQILQSYTKKLNGLVFLHAATLVGMTPAGADDDEETEALVKALNNIKTIFQVDPKIALCLMSRRPFSSMLRDIRHFMDQPYQTYFEESIVKGNHAFTEFL